MHQIVVPPDIPLNAGQMRSCLELSMNARWTVDMVDNAVSDISVRGSHRVRISNTTTPLVIPTLANMSYQCELDSYSWFPSIQYYTPSSLLGPHWPTWVTGVSWTAAVGLWTSNLHHTVVILALAQQVIEASSVAIIADTELQRCVILPSHRVPVPLVTIASCHFFDHCCSCFPRLSGT
jgi:hypothetical protein